MIAIIICIAILITLFVMAIYKFSNDAMDRIMQVQSGKKWEEIEGLDGSTYWLPEGNEIKTQSTIK